MTDRASIKERAMSMFKCNYWLNVALFAILSAITGTISGFASMGGNLSSIARLSDSSDFGEVAIALTAVSLVLSIAGIAVAIFLQGALSVSDAKASLHIYDGNRPDFKHILFGFSGGRYWKSVGSMALAGLLAGLAAIVVVIPVVVVTAIVMSGLSSGSELSVAAMTAICVVLALAACIPAFILAIGFAQVPYVVADEGRSGMDAIRRSWQLMRGHKGEYFVFGLSFLGWIILTALTFGVLGIFYTGPYMRISYAGYYRELVYSGEPVLMGEPAVDESGNYRF